MSDFKSKLPDLKEVTSMATKLFKDVKMSVSEIIVEYKKKRAEEAAEAAKAQPAATTTSEKVVTKTEKVEIVEKKAAPKKTKTKDGENKEKPEDETKA